MPTPLHATRSPICAHADAFARDSGRAERSTRAVMWITIAMMVVEITAGWWFNSMALLADGWHMSSHALAIGLSAWAYAAARRYASDGRFAFGTWKIEILGGYTSALLDLHVWRVGKASYACALTLQTANPLLTAEVVRQRLSVHEEVTHTTVEIRLVQPAAPSQPSSS